MKRIIVAVVIMLFVAACWNDADVTGVYMRYAESAYAKAWDTMIVRNDVSGYVIERRSGTQRKLNGVWQEKMMRNSIHTIILDRKTGQWYEEKTGKYFTFSRRNKTLTAGQAIYHQINSTP
jgi:hypothetical protein